MRITSRSVAQWKDVSKRLAYYINRELRVARDTGCAYAGLVGQCQFMEELQLDETEGFAAVNRSAWDMYRKLKTSRLNLQHYRKQYPELYQRVLWQFVVSLKDDLLHERQNRQPRYGHAILDQIPF